jgi:hypothetical protein
MKKMLYNTGFERRITFSLEKRERSTRYAALHRETHEVSICIFKKINHDLIELKEEGKAPFL